MIWIWRPFACSPCQVQTKAPQTLINIGMNFGVRVAFDYGNCTGPDCKFDWEPLGLEMQQGTTLSLSLSRYFIYVWKDYKLYGDNTCVLTFWWIHEYWPFRWLVAKNLVFLEVMIGAYLRASFSILIWQKQSNQIFWINQDAWEYPIKPICG